VTPRPGVPVFDAEFLRALQEQLAMIAAARRSAFELRERAETYDRAAIAAEAALEERIAEALREAAAVAPAVPASRRPRLEESPNRDDRQRAAHAVALLQMSPGLSGREIARRSRVHRSVVARLRDELAEKVAEKVADKSP
jgi:hypothetical protein